MSAVEDICSDDPRVALEAVRKDLAQAFIDADVNVKAQVAAQLRAVLADIRSLPALPQPVPSGVVTLDAAKARRADRQQSAAAPDAVATSGGGKRRR
mgnify:CR=1 FL=1